MTTKTYNGHKNWNHWNVSLWINNDEGLYLTALGYARSSRNRRMAASGMLSELRDMGITKTPDGAPYTLTTIAHAMQEM